MKTRQSERENGEPVTEFEICCIECGEYFWSEQNDVEICQSCEDAEELSECCGAPIHEDQGLCSQCKEHL